MSIRCNTISFGAPSIGSPFLRAISEKKRFPLIRSTADDLELKILAMEVMPDHIHLLVDAKPQCRLPDSIKVFKGNIARRLFMDHPELKRSLWGGHLWNPSYFVCTVSERTRDQATRYIESQKTE